MASKVRLQENVANDVQNVRVSTSAIEDAAKNPRGRTVADVDLSERLVHEAVTRAADSARILVREEGG